MNIEGITEVEFHEFEFVKDVSILSHLVEQYIAPEVWLQVPLNFKADIWSIGCIILEIVLSPSNSLSS